MQPIDELKLILREEQYPFFEDDEIQYYLDQNNGKVGAAAYVLLMRKAVESSITLPGLTLPETQRYFRRLAAPYRKSNSGVLGRR